MDQLVTQLEIEGEISGQTIPALIRQISQTGETGVFKVVNGKVEKSVYFHEGRAIFATSNDPQDRLGELFFRQGLVSLANLLKAVEVSLGTKKRMGTFFVEFGIIRPEGLLEGVTEQVKGILLSIFHWTEGMYSFRMGPLPTEEVITLQISTGDIIIQGIKEIQNWQRIWEAVGGLETSYQNTDQIEKLTKGVTLSLDEWTLLSHLERSRTLEEICSASPLKDFEICRLLWAFLVLGIASKCS